MHRWFYIRLELQLSYGSAYSYKMVAFCLSERGSNSGVGNYYDYTTPPTPPPRGFEVN